MSNADRDKRWYEQFIAGSSFDDLASAWNRENKNEPGFKRASRSAVAGAIWRYRGKLGLPGAGRQPKSLQNNGKIRKTRQKAAAASTKPYHMTIEQLSPKDCRYPYGDIRTTGLTFCGHTCAPGSPYCPAHHALCLYKPRKSVSTGAIESIALENWRSAKGSEANARRFS
jgi:hypothetical protein